jgi:RHS repeat-associated protein
MFATYPEINGGMYYADQRMYNPQMGKFVSPDPFGVKTAKPKSPVTWNRYAYANGDPLNYRDRQGLAGIFLDGADDTDYYGDESGCDTMNTKYQAFPNPCDVTNVVYVAPVVAAAPAPTPASTCSGGLVAYGQPINGQPAPKPVNQSFAGAGIANAPKSGNLGGYYDSGPGGGWFNAVQIQFNTTAGNGDWLVIQEATETGTQTIGFGAPKSVNISDPNDFPGNQAVAPLPIYNTARGTPVAPGNHGYVDWLDTPGQGRVTVQGTVTAALETFSFTSSIDNTMTGQVCSFNWSFTFSLAANGTWNMY